MKVLVTGAAGFIGSSLSLRFLERGDEVVGIHNHNDYYSPALREARLARQEKHPNYTHVRSISPTVRALKHCSKPTSRREW